jgi:hypothetical protein
MMTVYWDKLSFGSASTATLRTEQRFVMTACRNYAEDVTDGIDYFSLVFWQKHGTYFNVGTQQLGRQVQKYNPYPFHSSARSWKFITTSEVCVL